MSPQEMKQIPLTQYDSYASCPKRLEYETKHQLFPIVTLEPKPALLKHLVLSSYSDGIRDGSRSSWKNVVGLIDDYSYSTIDTADQSQLDKAYSQSLKYLRIIKRDWYDKYYLVSGDGLPNCPISYPITTDIEIIDTVDLVTYIGDKIVLNHFGNQDLGVGTIFNNLRLRGQQLLLSLNLKMPVTTIRYFTWINNDIIVKDTHIKDPYVFMQKTGKALKQITEGIQDQVFYTSVNTQCLTCPFRSICSM